MPSYLITGGSRGIGVRFLDLSLPFQLVFTLQTLQLEFVRQLGADSRNTVFALVRSKITTDRLLAVRTENVHILEADITDHIALKVSRDTPT